MTKQILLQENEYTYIDVEFSHDPSEKIDIVLNCPHGFQEDGTFAAFPEMKEALRHIPEKTLREYFLLEFDFESKTIANAMFHELKKTKRVAVIHFYYDRGILDGNRQEYHAVRKIFNHEKYPEMVKKLQLISRHTGQNILEFCKKNLRPDGLFVDVHSMWPTCQHIRPSDFEHHQRLEKYVDALLNPKNQKEARAINFLVHDCKESPIADVKRTQIVSDFLRKNEYPVLFDLPYRFISECNSYNYFQSFSGVALDIPRTFLGNPIPQAKLPEWKEDEKKIQKLGQILSEGICLAVDKKPQILVS